MKTLTGYPASYGSDTELNDHHFHYGYYVYAAAIIAQYDPSWAADSAWGGMVKTLVRDTANPSRTDSAFLPARLRRLRRPQLGLRPPGLRHAATTRSRPPSRPTSARLSSCGARRPVTPRCATWAPSC
ncbi:glycosyl hydrolase [Streptomyces thermocarboxydus]